MSRPSLLATASFRLTAIYLVFFALSALAVGGFAFAYIQRAQLRGFAERVEEESQALARLYASEGRARLIANIDARSAGGGSLVYGLYGADGRRLAGLTPNAREAPALGWSEATDWDEPVSKEDVPDIVRVLTTRLGGGELLVVGDERTNFDKVMRDIATAFLWALGVALALGLGGGLWLSRHFLARLAGMHGAARAILHGDWRQRIPEAAMDDDLAALARTFNRMFDRIEKLLLAQKQVSSDIAHDLRRPLARVLRDLETSRSSSDASAIERAIAGVEEVLQTFEALLRIGEIESGVRRAAFVEFDLSALVGEVVEAFRPSAEDEGRVFNLKLEHPLPMRGDVALLRQAVANLIDNALRHTPPGTRVEVAARGIPSGVRVEVADCGPGVAEADLPHLFRRFFRGDAARRAPGSGLGLALVAAIADLHDMEAIAQDNRPGLRIAMSSMERA